MQSIVNLPVIGLDLAKSVFQLHIVDIESGEIQRRQIKRAKLTEFFANCQPSLVAMEACGTSHFWARTIRSLGHQVKLLPAQHVKAFLLRDKTDAMDAQAIWVAAQQPHILPVPVKTEHQQTCIALHGMRRQLMKMRIMQTNALRGILAEFGIAMPVGHKQLLKVIQGELAAAQQDDLLPTVLVISVQEQLKRIDVLQNDIDHIGQRLLAMIRDDRQMQAIQQIPGVGDLTASALVAAVGDFHLIQVRAPVCIVGGADATASGHRGQDAAAGYFQAGRYLPANSADRGSQSSSRPVEEDPLDRETAGAAPLQCSRRGTGQQDGPNRMGGTGQRQSL